MYNERSDLSLSVRPLDNKEDVDVEPRPKIRNLIDNFVMQINQPHI